MTNPPTTKKFGSNWAHLISTEDDWGEDCDKATPAAFATTDKGPLQTISGTINS
jgi:hypothetical protein